MKKSNLILIICIFSTLLIFIKEVKASFFNDNELVQITDIAKKHKIKIKKWSLFIKEPIVKYENLVEIENKIEIIKVKEKGYTWTKPQFNKDHYKIVGEKKNLSLNIHEKILIIYFPFKDKYNLSVTYDIKGSNWNKENWSEISNIYKSKIENFSVFYTVEGVTNINKPLYTEATNLLQSFSGESIQILNEENFVSLSALTQRWETKLPLENDQFMNLQIAFRDSMKSNYNTKVTIGTPIITSEY